MWWSGVCRTSCRWGRTQRGTSPSGHQSYPRDPGYEVQDTVTLGCRVGLHVAPPGSDPVYVPTGVTVGPHVVGAHGPTHEPCHHRSTSRLVPPWTRVSIRSGEGVGDYRSPPVPYAPRTRDSAHCVRPSRRRRTRSGARASRWGRSRGLSSTSEHHSSPQVHDGITGTPDPRGTHLGRLGMGTWVSEGTLHVPTHALRLLHLLPSTTALVDVVHGGLTESIPRPPKGVVVVGTVRVTGEDAGVGETLCLLTPTLEPGVRVWRQDNGTSQTVGGDRGVTGSAPHDPRRVETSDVEGTHGDGHRQSLTWDDPTPCRLRQSLRRSPTSLALRASKGARNRIRHG